MPLSSGTTSENGWHLHSLISQSVTRKEKQTNKKNQTILASHFKEIIKQATKTH